MPTLVITDIPRISALFEQLKPPRSGLLVVSEIHRGIEELDRLKPNLIIIQNHLSGLSADIVHKHLKSRLGRRKVRFALISASDRLDPELSQRFETIIDPSQDEEDLLQTVTALLNPQRPQATSILDLPPVRDDEPGLFDLNPQQESPSWETEAPAPAAETAVQTPEPAAAVPAAPQELIEVPAPLTYERPRRANQSIISAFSQHLDTSRDGLTAPDQQQLVQREEELAIRDFHLAPHLISDYEEGPAPLHRRPLFWIVTGTVALVLAVTLFQHRPAPKEQLSIVPDKERAASRAIPAVPEVPPAAPAQTLQPAPPAAPAPLAPGQERPLQSHGPGRPKTLPSFIPRDGLDRTYGRDNPGWEVYRGTAAEYRIFREKDSTIKAIQVIDRSGAGLQDSYYISILKELAGTTAMQPFSSEIKEGYEIRRGESSGLSLVQYRDAQGGRLRGIVITWP